MVSIAERQFGQVRWDQMRDRGVAKAAISRASAAGRLHEIHPRVYSVVPTSLMTDEAWMAAAILAGGEGARLCCESAGWWATLLKERPPEIHVAVGCDLDSLPGVVWHRLSMREGEERVFERGLPITPPVRIPLDVAARMSSWELKGLLAELEFHHDIKPEQVATTLRRGYAGSAKLRKAIADHTPELAATRSQLEKVAAQFMRDRGFILPSFNAAVGRATVDAVFSEQKVILELDGIKGHAGDRRIDRDHRRDLYRRADGFTVLRYSYAQFLDPAQQDLIEAEFIRLGIPRQPCW